MEKLIMNKAAVDKAIALLSRQIVQQNKGTGDLGLVGIRAKGHYLAQLIADYIKQAEGVELPVGTIDTTLYRDDVSVTTRRPILCHTQIPFPVTNKKIILVDDVLYTGRTIRAALDALIDLGRPQAIELAVLIDRGHRELPIQADYVGRKVPAKSAETIKLIIIDQDVKEHKVILLEVSTTKSW